jgi:hypothetical protein
VHIVTDAASVKHEAIPFVPLRRAEFLDAVVVVQLLGGGHNVLCRTPLRERPEGFHHVAKSTLPSVLVVRLSCSTWGPVTSLNVF